MFVQDKLFVIATSVVDRFPNSKFLIMFAAVVVGPLVVFAVSGSNPHLVDQTSRLWALLAIAMLLLISAGIGLLRFRDDIHTADGLSIIVGNKP